MLALFSIFDVPGVLGRNLDHNRVKVSCCVKETHSPSLPNSASGPPRRICSRTISLRCLRPTRCSHTSYMYNSRIVSTWSNLMSSNKMAFTSCRSRAPREGRTPCGQGPPGVLCFPAQDVPEIRNVGQARKPYRWYQSLYHSVIPLTALVVKLSISKHNKSFQFHAALRV